MNQQSSGRPPRKQNIVKWIALCVSLALIVYGGIRLGGYLIDLASSRRTAEELKAVAEEETAGVPAAAESPLPAAETVSPPTAAPSAEESGTAGSDTLPEVKYPDGYKLVPRIQKLRKKSENIIGWLSMDDLDEPVALRDNVFFLNHDATGNRNVNGAIFMDENTKLLTRPYTVFLYGHNMKSGAMFGNLRKYQKPEYCQAHRSIRFDTLYEEGQFESCAVTMIRVTPGLSGYVNLWDLESADRAVRREAIGQLRKNSQYYSTLKVSEEDQLLLLITCEGDADQRLVVTAKRTD